MVPKQVAPVVNRGATQQSVYLPLGASWFDLTSYWSYDAGNANKSIGLRQRCEFVRLTLA